MLTQQAQLLECTHLHVQNALMRSIKQLPAVDLSESYRLAAVHPIFRVTGYCFALVPKCWLLEDLDKWKGAFKLKPPSS